MSLHTLARKFVDLCNQLMNFHVMHSMYDPDIVSAEGGGEDTVRKAKVIQESEIWQANNTIHVEIERCLFFNGDNQVGVHLKDALVKRRGGGPRLPGSAAVRPIQGGVDG